MNTAVSNNKLISDALWRSAVANTNLNSLLFIVAAVLATLAVILQIPGINSTFFVASILAITGALTFGLAIYLYVNWVKRNDSLPDLVTPFGVAFTLCLFAVTWIWNNNNDDKQEQMKFTNLTFAETITVGIVVLFGFVGFIDGSIRSDNIYTIIPYVAVAFTKAKILMNTGIGYLNSVTAASESEKETKVFLYVLSFFFVFVASTVLINKVMERFGFKEKPGAVEKNTVLAKSVVQQKKIIVFGLFTIVITTACFLWVKCGTTTPTVVDFNAWWPYLVTLLTPVVLSVVAVLLVFFKNDSPELYNTFAGIVLAFLLLIVGIGMVDWSVTLTGLIFIAASILFVAAAAKSSSISVHTISVLLFAFGIGMGRIVSGGNRLLLLLFDLFVVLLLYQIQVADSDDIILFTVAAFLQSVSPFFFEGVTWDDFGKLFSLFLAKIVFVRSLRLIVMYLADQYGIVYGNVFSGFKGSNKITRKVFLITYTVIANVLVDILLRYHLNKIEIENQKKF